MISTRRIFFALLAASTLLVSLPSRADSGGWIDPGFDSDQPDIIVVTGGTS